ncbi:MAG: aspartate aminotransferase family protein [Paludibacteraceae bacterium]|nr:aspartate aminotransferase family protein [Paludibacteraceae bacterium]
MSTQLTQTDKSVLVDIDRQHLIHPQHHPSEYDDPQIWVEGKGIYITNYEGNTYIDGLSGMWNVYVGHGRKELADAATKQLQRLAFATAYAGSSNLPAIELAETLKELIYPNIEAFYFTLGGSDATDTSIRTARFYWKAKRKPEKLKIIASKLGYHGSSVGSASATGVDEFSEGFGPRLPNFVHIESANPYRFKTTRTDVNPGVAAADLLEEAILREGADTIAAFIIEPVQGGGGGIIVPPADYFQRIREITTKYNILLISDEVITGFGRTGKWFALEHWGVQPDIVQFAKGITSGYFPLGGIGISGEIKNVLDSVDSPHRWWHGYTYSAHPVGTAVALANIRILKEEHLVERSALLGKKLLERLQVLNENKYVGEIRGLGLLLAIELVADKVTKESFPVSAGIGTQVRQQLLRRGLCTRVLGEIVCLAPPLTATEEEIDKIADIVIASINTVLSK